MTIAINLLLVALQLAGARDPHGSKFTRGTGLPCAYCHQAKNPHAEDMYRAAGRMSKMVDGLNTGPLRQGGGISCFTCHRGGEGGALHPPATDRSAVQRAIDAWPGNPGDPDAVKRAMSQYTVALGVRCAYCHVPGKWNADDKPPMRQTRTMIKLMDEFPKYFNLASASAFTCYTCHQGAPKTVR